MARITGYSDCHLSPVMYSEDWSESSFMGECSFCGRGCRQIAFPDNVNHDIELTLRRWKDGDCSLDDMFGRLKTEYKRIWGSVAEPAREKLCKGQNPMYAWNPAIMDWEATGVRKQTKVSGEHSASKQASPATPTGEGH